MSVATGGGKKPAAGVASGDWLARPEGGNWFALWLIRAIGLHLGRPAARTLLYPIALYFYCRRGPERRAAVDYFHRLGGTRRNAWRALRLIHAYAATILDRVFLLARGLDGFDVTIAGEDELLRQLGRGRGVLLLGAHVGSFDVLRALSARHPRYSMKLVMDRSKTPALTSLLESLAPALMDSVIDTARGGPGIVLALADAVREGAIIALLADRARPGEDVHAVPFLGAPAPFPTAPWRIAAALGVPVVLGLGLYQGGNRYRLVFETLAERVDSPRGDRDRTLAAGVARYAARLEHHLRAEPWNWFNLHDFWEPAVAASASRAASGEPARAQAA